MEIVPFEPRHLDDIGAEDGLRAFADRLTDGASAVENGKCIGCGFLFCDENGVASAHLTLTAAMRRRPVHLARICRTGLMGAAAISREIFEIWSRGGTTSSRLKRLERERMEISRKFLPEPVVTGAWSEQ